jgi:acetolactate synthase-1/2/3 large subunit/5-guanidino-2-oxopentanoate decarboxylase
MTDATRPLGAQVSHMLKDRGVDVIFGIPGVHNVEMYRGIEEAGLRHILARHEGGAGFMADGYARASGRLGVAYIITGPGLTNILTPLGQSYSDSVSVLVLSACLDDVTGRQGQLHQMLDQRAAAATVCDWSEEARDADAVYGLVNRALHEHATPDRRPRPRHIQVPIATLGAPAAAPVRAAQQSFTARATSSCGVAARIAAARRPLFIFGGGIVDNLELTWPEEVRASSRTRTQLARYALDRSGAACFTTYAARGLIPGAHPLNFGPSLANRDSRAVFGRADLIVAIGTELAEVDLWRRGLGHDCPLIRVDIDSKVLNDGQARQEPVLQDAGAFLAGLCDELPGTDTPKWTAAEVAAFRAANRAAVDAARPGIVPVCDALRAALPSETMYFSDMTQFAYVAKEVWDMDRPGHWHHPFGFGTLGYALPAAIGGAVARPGLPTVAIAGDYGLQYTIQELGTAVELGLPLPILLWDNAKLKEIEDCMVASQIAPNAVVAQNPDFLALARAYGAHAAEPDSLEALQQAALAALKADRPTLIRMTPALTA